jgi:hypothetical protein
MGMFDSLHSSLPLFDPQLDKDLQVKGLSDAMTTFWLNSAGELYEVNYFSAYERVEVVDPANWHDFFKWTPNGKNGVITPFLTTAIARVYPAQWGGSQKNWPELQLYFKHGLLKDVTSIPNRY